MQEISPCSCIFPMKFSSSKQAMVGIDPVCSTCLSSLQYMLVQQYINVSVGCPAVGITFGYPFLYINSFVLLIKRQSSSDCLKKVSIG
jgi:hypothetical protein